MSILSFEFAGFVAIALIMYYILPKKCQWAVLLTASYVFYLYAGWKTVGFILVTTVTTWYGAGRIGDLQAGYRDAAAVNRDTWSREERRSKKASYDRKQRNILILVVMFNIGMLAVFKFRRFIPWFDRNWIMPLGISFYTFQTVGYIVDVYRGKIGPERHFGRYALFTSYFPSITEGPINRYQQMRDQFRAEHPFCLDSLKSGAGLFIWGLFKKLVIANRIAMFTKPVFSDPDSVSVSGARMLLAVLLWSLQLYGDFSGGIDMIRGVSRMFGIEVADNFRRPFFSKTLSEYWHRWHISLSMWLQDYVFYPLALSKAAAKIGKKARKRFGAQVGKTLPGAIASVVTFLLIGLWHDVALYYVAYGLWHGVLLGLSNMTAPAVAGFTGKCGIKTDCTSFRLFQRVRTYLIISVGELFTLTGSLSSALRAGKKIFTSFQLYTMVDLYKWGIDEKDWFVLVLALIVLLFISYLQEYRGSVTGIIKDQNVWMRWLIPVTAILVIGVFGVYGPGYQAADFVYKGF
jgi:alginate O-acetyltransferase complex protein AlgI